MTKRTRKTPAFPEWMGPKLQNWLHRQRARLEKKDVLVLITGPEGNGKSSLAFHLGGWFDPGLDLERIVYSGKEFISLGQRLGARKVRIWDEAKEGGFNRRAMSGQNVDVAEHLFEARILHQVSLVIWPNINYLEGVISEHRAVYWILVENLGFARLHKLQRADYKGAKPWHKELFTFDFPEFTAPWWKEYEERKELRARGKPLNANQADPNGQLIQIRRGELAGVLRRALAAG